MSVRPSVSDIPPTRVPKRLASRILGARGSNATFIWQYGQGPFVEGPFAEGLALRPDAADHGNVEPTEPMQPEDVLDALADTQLDWSLADEEQT